MTGNRVGMVVIIGVTDSSCASQFVTRRNLGAFRMKLITFLTRGKRRIRLFTSTVLLFIISPRNSVPVAFTRLMVRTQISLISVVMIL